MISAIQVRLFSSGSHFGVSLKSVFQHTRVEVQTGSRSYQRSINSFELNPKFWIISLIRMAERDRADRAPKPTLKGKKVEKNWQHIDESINFMWQQCEHQQHELEKELFSGGIQTIIDRDSEFCACAKIKTSSC
jgi:hypothetical protein